MTHPQRDNSESKIEALKQEQECLEDREKKLEEKLNIRKKQFHVLVSSIHELQSMLAEDEDMRPGENFEIFIIKFYYLMFQTQIYQKTAIRAQLVMILILKLLTETFSFN